MANNAVASTSRGEPRAEPEVATKKPRPKPRRKLPTGSIQAAPFAPPSDLSSTITSAPRNVPTTVPLESILPVDLGPQDIPLTIADRAKSRVRNAKSKPVVQDIIDIPSDEDDRLLQLSPYRPKQKDAHRAKTRPIPDLPPPSIHPSQESLVTPTSDFQPAPAISSQLPPSDPPSSMLPLPTSTPESAKKRRQAVDAGDAEESPLNPSKKWKRRRVDLGDDENNQTRVSPPQAIATDGQPPNFFASSSSSLPPPPAPLVRGESRKEKLVNRNQLNDGVSPPRAIDSGRRREKKSRSKPKKKFPVQPEPNEVGNPPPISAPTSRSRLNAEAAGDTDEEAGLLVLPPPSRQLEPQSPLSDLSDASSRASKPVTPSSNRERLVPEVVITTVPRKRTSSPQIQAAKEGRSIGEDRTGESAKGRKRRKKVVEEDYFDGLDDQVEVTPKKGPKGKGKALPRGKSRTKPQPKEVVVDEESEGDRFDDVTKVSKKVKTKVKAKATAKAKSIRSRVVDSDDEVTADSTMKNSGLGAAPADDDRTGDFSTAVHQNMKRDEIALPQDTRVSLNLVVGSGTVLIATSRTAKKTHHHPPIPNPTRMSHHPLSLGKPLLLLLHPHLPDSTTATPLRTKKRP